jgi:hypothetical protein
MDQVIELIGANLKLILRCNTKGWCKCNLIYDDQIYVLGQEHISYITDRILDIFCDNEQEKVVDQSYKWVLSLADLHCSLYAKRKQRTISLLWQDANTKTIAKVDVSYEESNEWCNQLRQIESLSN